jgi:predicted phage terminase large subunit-like protein
VSIWSGRSSFMRRYASPLALAQTLDRRIRITPALGLVDRTLVSLRDRTLRTASGAPVGAVHIALPPQEGKSTTAVLYHALWLLAEDPTLHIVVVSYEARMAERWGRLARNMIAMHPELGIGLASDSKAAGQWETTAGGSLFCTGLTGPLTGKRADVLIIDDPLKNEIEAESATKRRRAWEWWEAVALTRLAPGGKVVLICTRWHTDDLPGRIMGRPSVLTWAQLSIPAIAGKDDPLNREPGQELVSAQRRPRGYFRALAGTMSSYFFAAMYQQNPVSPQGNFFRRATFCYWRPLPPWSDGRAKIDMDGRAVTLENVTRFCTMDCAGSEAESADFTVVMYWLQLPTGDLVLWDMERERVPVGEHFTLVQRLFTRNPACTVYVEHNFYASAFIQMSRDFGRWGVAPVRADAKKHVRAEAAVHLANGGNLWLPSADEAPWVGQLVDELVTFPAGDHDDQVDAVAYAARVYAQTWVRPEVAAARYALPRRDPGEAAIAAAFSSAVGGLDSTSDDWGQPAEVDFSRIEW